MVVDLCLVNDLVWVTISICGARIFISAIRVAFYFITWFSEFVGFSFGLVRDDGFDIAHAALAQFESVSVEDFVEWICQVLGKCWLIKERKYFPTIDSMFLLYGGLNNVMFLWQFLRG